MASFSSAFDTLLTLQQALDAFRTSGWLDTGPSAGGSYPPINVFRKGDDFVVIAEVPGVNKAELELQVKGKTIRLSGTKAVHYPEQGTCIAVSDSAAGSIAPSRCRSRSTPMAFRPSAKTAFSRCSCGEQQQTSPKQSR